MVQYLPLDKAGIISTVLEGALYGFSVLMFLATLWTLTSGRKYAQINIAMVVVACLLFILSTIHIISDIKRIYSGLVLFRDTYPGGPPAWFANVSDPSFVFKNAIYAVQTALGDGVVIYRCYVVWSSIWVIVFPVILWLSVVATGIGGVYILSQPTADSGDIFFQRSGQWITAFYATTLTCNLCATALLAYRLWMIERSVHRSRVGRGLTKPVLMVIIDAGALYSVTLFTALVCFVSKSNGQYVVLDMVTPIISIAFYMVILRIGIAQNSRSREGASTIQRTPLPRSETSNSDRFQPMHVHIERLTEVEIELEGKADEASSHQMSRI
ncbi:hypothetical protein B0H17DRAFT_1030505 [Mycena rosella]|uniref:Uncharacterized protein n=1 Tax=Mycena rosella TaxID=1033263 RepID=A0AAD7GZK7_MYCRO|nr:hypothetical protein B0H17DRAFT_1030505 [Mycena rosella]